MLVTIPPVAKVENVNFNGYVADLYQVNCISAVMLLNVLEIYLNGISIIVISIYECASICVNRLMPLIPTSYMYI